MATAPAGGSDLVQTVVAPASSSTLILGSKFIAHIAPAALESESEAILLMRSRRYPDASHHCWAHRVGRPADLIERSADAGEPTGTAGRPILDALRRACLQNVVCVVSRYFGGTRLGTGGLARAYADAAHAAIEAAKITSQTVVRTVAIDFDHERTGIVYRALEEFGVSLVEGRFDERAHGNVDVPVSRLDPLRRRLAQLALSGIDWHEQELKLR